MNRYTALFLTALVAIVVACNVDRSTSNGIERMPPTVMNSAGTDPQAIAAFTYDAAGTVVCLLDGDTVKTTGANLDTMYIFADGYAARKIAIQRLQLDTITQGQPHNSFEWPHSGYSGFGRPGVFFGTVNSGFNGVSAIDSSSNVGITRIADSSGVARIRGLGVYLGDGWNAFEINADSVGVATWENLSHRACVINPPANAVLANNGPFNWKVTWSNNGNTYYSTEVWFGTLSNMTLQGTASPTTTSWVGSFPGHGLFYAFVQKVRSGVKSAQVWSGSLTH